MTWTHGNRRNQRLCLALAGAAVLVACAMHRTDVARGQAADDPATREALAWREMQIKEVAHAFRGKVDIYLDGEELGAEKPSLANVQVSGVKQAAGIIFLYVPTEKGHMLINPHHIAAVDIAKKR